MQFHIEPSMIEALDVPNPLSMFDIKLIIL